jgi:tetratricopeptide (TPR) repeat protein
MAERPDRPARDDRAPRSGPPKHGGPHRSSGAPQRDGSPRRDGDARRDSAPRRDGTGYRGVRPAGAGRVERPNRPEGDNDRPRHDDPEIPETVSGQELDRIARNELKTLAKENADRVAQHLVMAGLLIENEPALAHRHAQAAARRAGRIALTRETLAITAYAVGDYALALRELRTYRRISGSNEQLPLMVDCERGLGRPEKALELGRSVDRRTLAVATRVELAIAMSGARLDLGQSGEALTELEIPQLDAGTAFSYSPGLFDTYAIVLAELGRHDEADEWGRRADVAANALAAVGMNDGDETIEILEEEPETDGDDER